MIKDPGVRIEDEAQPLTPDIVAKALNAREGIPLPHGVKLTSTDRAKSTLSEPAYDQRQTLGEGSKDIT